MNEQTTLEVIENALRVGQVAPPTLASYKDWLAAESSTLMDKQLERQLSYASYYEAHREAYKSDKGLLQAWRRTAEGREELMLDTAQKKIKVLREAISSHLRVADNAARNLY